MIGEPRLDWMYDQSNCPKVSRLIVADREPVAVSFRDKAADGAKTEKALIGKGETNPFVVLVHELLARG